MLFSFGFPEKEPTRQVRASIWQHKPRRLNALVCSIAHNRRKKRHDDARETALSMRGTVPASDGGRTLSATATPR